MNLDEFPLERAIEDQARAAGLRLDSGAVAGLALHARAVATVNPRLHLTSIADPGEFIERHIGESLQGAAQIATELRGTLVDLGSGNGYPGIPIALTRPGLTPALVEASAKKATFLRDIAHQLGWPESAVIERSVQAPRDVAGLQWISALVSRAMGGWERIIPKLTPLLTSDGVVLLWAGAEVDDVRHRTAWRRLELDRKVALPGRDRSWIWRFRLAAPNQADRERI